MALHKVNHSTGLVIARGVPGGSQEWSFIIHPTGRRELRAGWNRAGQVPQVPLNPPPNDRAVLTVAVEDTSARTLRGLQKLRMEHQEHFGECQVHLAGDLAGDRALRNWLLGRQPEKEPKVSEAGDDEDEDEGDDSGTWDTTSDPEAAEPTGDPDLQALADEASAVPGVDKPAKGGSKASAARARQKAAKRAGAKKARAPKSG